MLDLYEDSPDQEVEENDLESISFFDSFPTIKELGLSPTNICLIQEILNTLPEREQTVLKLKFGIHGKGNEVNTEDVGLLLDLSDEEVTACQEEAFRLLFCNPRLKQLHNELV